MHKKKENAVVYCEGSFNTTNGKTAHGLVRFTERYDIQSIIDSRYKGQDAGMALDGKNNGIPIVGSLEEAMKVHTNKKPTRRTDFPSINESQGKKTNTLYTKFTTAILS